jgi:dTDP-4-amino-4,6-dideoxygalactose transaminase
MYKVPFVNYGLQYKNLKREIDLTMQDVLSRGDLILRKDTDEFEERLAKFVGTKYAIALNSGTDALFFSLIIAGIKPGDEVITASHTFMASISTIVQIGATPILADVKEDFSIDTDQLEKLITEKTKAIIPVHINGRMCDMDKIMQIAEKHKLIVIEDSAQSLGASYNGKKAGSIGFSGCFSFYPAKILGCFGDGGALTTNDINVAEKTKLLRDHGQKTKTEILCFGWNSRLDNLQAAVLNVKLNYLPKWIERRREIAKIYDNGLKCINQIKLPKAPDSDEEHFDVFQNYVLMVEKRDELFNFLKENQVETLIKDPIPNHKHSNLNLDNFKLPITERMAKEVISLPMYPELTDEQVEYVIGCVKNFYNQN